MNLIEQLKQHEGFRERPYQCTSGVWTFGYGLTFITPEEAEVVLAMRVDSTKKQLRPHMVGLNEARKNVIINMAYNLGVKGVLQFKRMWAALDAGDFDARQVGRRAVELAEIMRKG